MNLPKSPFSFVATITALMLCAVVPVTVVHAQGPSTPHTAGPQPAFTLTVTSPAKPMLGKPASIALKVAPAKGALTSGVVDIEVYNEAGKKLGQQVAEAQTINTGQSHTYKFDWKAPKAGKYQVKIGIFATKWSKLLQWNDNAGEFTVK